MSARFGCAWQSPTYVSYLLGISHSCMDHSTGSAWQSPTYVSYGCAWQWNMDHRCYLLEMDAHGNGGLGVLAVAFQIWTWINHIYYEIIFTWTVSYAMSTKHLLTFTVSTLSLFHEMYPPFHNVSIVSLCHERSVRGVD